MKTEIDSLMKIQSEEVCREREYLYYSLFVTKNGDKKEYHDLPKEEALEKALKELYDYNGDLNAGVSIEIRNPDCIIFSATNPIKNN